MVDNLLDGDEVTGRIIGDAVGSGVGGINGFDDGVPLGLLVGSEEGLTQ